MSESTRAFSSSALSGRRIAIPETRQASVFAELLERRGARVLRCPLVGIHPAPDPAPVLDWLQMFSAGGCDDLILLTGEGLRRLHALALLQPGSLATDFVTALGNTRKICRGPKPNKALRELGLSAEISAPSPTTAGVIRALAELDLQGRRVGVQLYGTEPNLVLIDAIATAGGTPLIVAPYVYADEIETSRVQTLIDDLLTNQLDAIAFTSTPQIRRLFSVAKSNAQEAELLAAMNRTCVAAVGPIVADVLTERGVAVSLMPAESFFMKPLVTELLRYFEATPS